jgi:transcriptional regulator with XRE-family HTH domain
MDFQELRGRFVDHLRERVRSGQLTERGLARVTGISQPHIHNVLKGKRLLSPEMSDAILRNLRMDLLDLMKPEDLMEWRARKT